MKPKNNLMLTSRATKAAESGMALMDVLLAIAVFAFGMLALVQLQGSLARSSADANHRTVAVNLAEEFVETLRAYRFVDADPNNNLWDYREIEGNALNDTVTVGDIGIEFNRTVTVSNFWWDDAGDTYVRTDSATPPDGLDHLVYPDFKLLRLDIAWGNSDAFYVEEGSTADLDSGSITIYEIISSTPAALGAHLLSPLETDSGPIVQYTPGDNPDIVALKLNDSGTRFKESTSAQPTVFHDDFVETWFDVVTYSQVNSDAYEFLRREEFVAISCQCELNTSPSEAEYGRTPTLWNGYSYTEGIKENKPIGTPVNNVQQSAFCDVCCRDHHDGAGTGAELVYNPANSANGASDHAHYDRDGQGNVINTAVGNGDTYVEACRLVRKDGFMRVTHDAKQQTLIGFPEGYLEFDAGILNYSDYVIDATETYYTTNSQGVFPPPTPPVSPESSFPARDVANIPDWTDLPTVTFSDSQQMRARSVYTDYLTTSAQQVIDDCFPGDGLDPSADCALPSTATELEIYPFFDLQMTYLASWEDDLGNGVIAVQSDGIETDDPSTPGPEYIRGLVSLATVSPGNGEVIIKSNPGNLGLTATGPIDPNYVETSDKLYVDANSYGGTPVPPVGAVVSGSLTSGVRRVGTSELTFSSDVAMCGNSVTAWSCVVPAEGASLTVSGYYINNPRVYVCSDLGTGIESDDLDSITFDLPGEGGLADIWVTTDSSTCP